ncbi:hypothetical protein TWF281_007841 [Arthrobotrys megalospora]
MPRARFSQPSTGSTVPITVVRQLNSPTEPTASKGEGALPSAAPLDEALPTSVGGLKDSIPDTTPKSPDGPHSDYSMGAQDLQQRIANSATIKADDRPLAKANLLPALQIYGTLCFIIYLMSVNPLLADYAEPLSIISQVMLPLHCIAMIFRIFISLTI